MNWQKGERERKRGQKYENKQKRNLKKAGFVAGVLCLASIGGVSAYLTDFDKADNQFTVGKVSIDLDEPGFKPEEQTKIEPGKDVKRSTDQKYRSKWCIRLSGSIHSDGRSRGSIRRWNTIRQKRTGTVFFPDADKLDKIKLQKTGDNQVYVYAYNEVLKPEQTTNTLFDSVKFLNIIEGQIDEKNLSIPIRAYAIQTSYTGGDSASVVDQARTAYEKYVNQNKGQEGQVTP